MDYIPDILKWDFFRYWPNLLQYILTGDHNEI